MHPAQMTFEGLSESQMTFEGMYEPRFFSTLWGHQAQMTFEGLSEFHYAKTRIQSSKRSRRHFFPSSIVQLPCAYKFREIVQERVLRVTDPVGTHERDRGAAVCGREKRACTQLK
jgi:hypothetical protein